MRGPDVNEALYEYIVNVGTREIAVQKELRAETAKLPMGQMQIGPDQGALLQVLVRILRAKRCIEIGTFTGYSALTVALALPPNGKIICCDVSEEWTSIGRRYWKKARVDKKIDLRLGPALETLKGLKGSFDFAFIDADKPSYVDYYEALIPRMRQRGVIMVDNVLWSGRVIDETADDDNSVAVKRFNDHVAADKRVMKVMLAVSDGITLISKL